MISAGESITYTGESKAIEDIAARAVSATVQTLEKSLGCTKATIEVAHEDSPSKYIIESTKEVVQ